MVDSTSGNDTHHATDDRPSDDILAVPAYFLAWVHECLARDERVGELDLTLDLRAGRLYITGNVSSVERREALSACVHELARDLEISNDTTVMGFTASGESEFMPGRSAP
jgi:hypothetical protein